MRSRGRQPKVVDTNVIVVANRAQAEPLKCANACAQALLQIKISGVLVIDDRERILREYWKHASLSGQPGVGDAFIKWIHDNAGCADLVSRIKITPGHQQDDFIEFPTLGDLSNFDRSDRKFAAVALAHPKRPPVLNATDSDWWNHRDALQLAGIRVEFVCGEGFE